MLATSSLGWWLGSRVKSPAEAAASATAPDPSIITAPIVQRPITETLALRGVVKSPQVTTVEIPPAPSEGEAVITRPGAHVGDEVAEGTVLLEVSGRPVIVLQGRVPMYRTLASGMEGRDVAQFERAAARLGFLMDEPDGVFGPETELAVQRLYEVEGYAPPFSSNPTDSRSTQLAALAEVDGSRRHLVEAEINARVTMRENVAAIAIARARLKRTKRNPRSSSDEIASARLELVRTRGAARRSAIATRHAVEAARDDLNIALERLREQQEKGGLMVPKSEIVFSPHLPAVVIQSSAKIGKVGTEDQMKLAAGSLVIRTLLVEGESQLVDVGDVGLVDAQLLGINFKARIVNIAKRLVTTSDGLRGYPTLLKARGAIPIRAIGTDVEITIRAGRTEDKRLTVPLSAVWSGPDGITKVTRILSDGTHQDVIVQAGPSGDGYVAIASEKGDLHAGELVVLGF